MKKVKYVLINLMLNPISVQGILLCFLYQNKIQEGFTMTGKERFLKILAHEAPDEVAYSSGGGPMWGMTRDGLTIHDVFAQEDAGAKLMLGWYRDLHSQLISVGNLYSYAPFEVMGAEIDYSGVMAEIKSVPFEDISDIDNYDVNDVIEKMRANEHFKQMIKQVQETKKLVSEDEVIAVGLYAPFTFAAQLIGMEDLMAELLTDEDGYVDKLLQFCKKIVIAYTKDMLEAGGDIVYTFDPVSSGDLISLPMFEEFVEPIMTEYVKELHDLCPYVMHHICGNTQNRFAALGRIGIDAISVDSIDMVKAHEDSDGKVVLAGNLNPAGVLVEQDAETVYNKSMALCKEMKGQGGFILAPGCDPSPLIRQDRFDAMYRAVCDYNNSL